MRSNPRVGRIVKALMALRGYTQEDIHEKTGINRSHLGRIIAKDGSVSTGVLCELADVLGVTTDRLLGRDEWLKKA